ncbi:MAG: glucosamine-6-phosphate deaminase [Bacteroidales bacterium]|nr:glucosamine-6-phosphate deaminase [Bacteroidales bacterium]
MKVIIRDTKKEGSVWAARHIVEAIKWKASQTDRPFVLGLPTGSTPLDVYAELIKMFKAGEVSFKNVITFNMDEYVGLPESHPESYHSFMYKNLFDHIDIPRENIHILNGNAPDLDKECEEYELAILDADGIDLFLGGVGEDGHLAFNEPFSSLNSRTRVMTLTQDTLEVNARFFDNDPDKVPKQAMSVGISTVCSADEVLILAFGSKKARAVKAAIEGPVSHYVTLSALQLHENGIVVLDEPAAGELKVNSYRYFKAVEAAESGK